tara:strand:+ start:582 stop:1022 length:441 start_codon:yes stop_codon:yes gene_type:complete
MAGTPKSVLGQVQKDPMQGYKGVGSYQPNVVGMASGGGFSQYDAPDHSHPEFQRMQQNNAPRRINAPQIPGLLANTNMPAKYPDITFQNSSNQGGLLGNISGWSGGVQQPELPGFPGYENLPSDWADKGYSWNDPNNPDLKYNIIS